jgi:hypothetical protein
MQNNSATALNDLLVTRDFDPKPSINGKPLPTEPDGSVDISKANMFSFDYTTQNKNYGTVVVLLGQDNGLEVYYGDNLGRGMEEKHRSAWYDFLAQLKKFAARNLMTFELNDLSRLKYTMQGMAAIKEGLFEGYYGKKNISYSDQPKQTRLMIKHLRNLDESEPRYRAIESLFVETADGERFRVPSRSLMHGRMLARHIAEGGTPYDALGSHMSSMISELATLNKFIRASRGRELAAEAASLTAEAVRHYHDLKAKARRMISQRGYHEARDSFDPAQMYEHDQMVGDIREMFLEQSLDERIEAALPVLARLKETSMKEANEFENWARAISEGTWSIPDTREQMQTLQTLMSKPLPVGPDAANAIEQLYDVLGDDELFDRLHELADQDANADARDIVQTRLNQLGIDLPKDDSVTPTDMDKGVAEGSRKAYLKHNNLVDIEKPLAGLTSEFEKFLQTHDPEEKQKYQQGIKQRIKSEPMSGPKGVLPEQDVAEGDINKTTYAEELAEKLFDESPNLQNQDDIIRAGYVMSKKDSRLVGRVDGIFRDEDFPSDFVSVYRYIQHNYGIRSGVEEDLDTDGVMMTQPSNMSSESVDPVLRLKQMIKY